MKDQLIKIMAYFNISATRFADEIGVQRSSISHILGGRNKPSYDFILKVTERYPSVNLSWLLTGKGNMMLDEEDKRKPDHVETDQQSGLLITDTKTDLVNSRQTEKLTEHEVDISKKHEVVTKVNSIDSIVVLYTDGTFMPYRKKEKDA